MMESDESKNMSEQEGTFEIKLKVKASLFNNLELLRKTLGEEVDTFYQDALEKGGAVKEVDQVHNRVVVLVDDENNLESTLFEYIDNQTQTPLAIEEGKD